MADLVASIPMKPPDPSMTSGRRALQLLAGSSDGCTETMLIAQGFNHDIPAALVRAGFATEHVERVRARAEWIDVRSLRITAAGRRVIGRR